MSKKWLNKGVVACCLLLPFVLAGCRSDKKDKGRKEVKEIAVTIEPLRYFAGKIAGDKYAFFPVVPAGQSPETYDPSPREMVRVGKSEAYFHINQLIFEQTLAASIRENNTGAYAFDLSEGMDFCEDPAGEHDPDGDDSADRQANHLLCRGHGGRDPHIWTSFKGAKVISANMLKAFSVLDKENYDYYLANYRRLTEELDALENDLRRQLKTLSCRSFMIYHPALTYFSREFGLTQYSIENEGKEPSPAILKALIEEAKAEKIKVVFVQKEFDRKHAEQIARAVDAATVVINPLDGRWDEQLRNIAKALAENGKAD